MTKAVQLGLIFAFAAGSTFAQRPGSAPMGNSLGNPLPPLSPIPPLVSSPRPQFGARSVPQRRFRGAGFFPLPYYYPEQPYYPANYSEPAEPMPPVTIIQQFAPDSQSPPPPVTSEMHEYATAAPPPPGEPPTFTIVLKNGTALQAAAASVQGGMLQIVDPNGEHRRIPLDTIDRETTRRRNAERNLHLQL